MRVGVGNNQRRQSSRNSPTMKRVPATPPSSAARAYKL
jgi:hypothetical protein